MNRLRGQALRGMIAGTVKPGDPAPLDEVLYVVGTTHTELLHQLATLKRRGKIRGYTTARGMVHVW